MSSEDFSIPSWWAYHAYAARRPTPHVILPGPAPILVIDGIPLKGRIGADAVAAATRRADRRVWTLPWAHAFACSCLPEQTFTCARCGRRVGYCLGASDNMSDACDFCWKPEIETTP